MRVAKQLRIGVAVGILAFLIGYWQDILSHPHRATDPTAKILYTEITSYVDKYSVKMPVKVIIGAKKHQIVHLKINSPGGDIKQGLGVIEAIIESEAKEIRVEIQDYAYSMAALIAMYADTLIIDNKCPKLKIFCYLENGIFRK